MTDELKLEDIIKVEAADLTEEAIVYLREHKSQLTDDQIKKFESVLEEKKEEGDNEDEGDDGDKKD